MQNTSKPGRVISIIGLVFAFVGLAVVGIVLSIIGLVRSKRVGTADVIAILGIVFNALAIIVGGVIILLVLVAYNNAQAQARDTKRAADAHYIIDAVRTYSQDKADMYPSTDPAQFTSEIATVQQGSDSEVFGKLSTTDPSAENSDIYKLVACGSSPVTGMEVRYYSEAGRKVMSLATGLGCNGVQVGSPDDPESIPQSDL